MNWKQGLRILAAGIFFLLPWAADAQQVNMYWNTGGCSQFSCWSPISAANPLPITGSFSATTTGFPGTAQTTGTPIAATTGGVTGTLPAGTEVVASNVGSTNGAYCKLGASATTSDQLIPPNSWFGFTVGSNTQLTCITSTSTTTVNMVGGAGLPTGSGGGGGSGGGSSGAVFGPTAVGSANANPPVVVGGTVTGAAGQNVQGLAIKPASTAPLATDQAAVTAESPNSQLSTATGAAGAGHSCATGTPATVVGCLGQIDDDVKGPIPAGTNTIGNVGADPSSGKGTPSSVPINVSSATTTQLVALSGSTKIYITSFDVVAGGTGNITFEYGTGTACAAGTTVLTGAYNLTAQAGIAKGAGVGAILIVPAGNALCVLTSASVQMSGSVSFQQF